MLPIFVHTALMVATCDGVTYASEPRSLWVPVSQLEANWQVQRNPQLPRVQIGNVELAMRKLVGADDWVVKLSELPKTGTNVVWDNKAMTATMERDGIEIQVVLRPKKVEIDLDDQELTAYQGSTLVLKTHISSGRNDGTPRGKYTAQQKSRMHYSRLYHFSPMPFSVQVSGNIFLHGYHEVPAYPASHGCIRLPIANAQALYEWVQIGTPITIR